MLSRLSSEATHDDACVAAIARMREAGIVPIFVRAQPPPTPPASSRLERGWIALACARGCWRRGRGVANHRRL
jgi:hypothetical protein